MTRERIAEIRGLAENATPGPWEWSDYRARIGAPIPIGDGEHRGQEYWDQFDEPCGIAVVETDGGYYGPGPSTGRFIAAMDPQTVLHLLSIAEAALAAEKAITELLQDLIDARALYGPGGEVRRAEMRAFEAAELLRKELDR